MIEVPLDRDRPRGRQVTIALTRAPATDTRHYQGVVLLNRGGPGGHGRDLPVRFARGTTGLPRAVGATYDWIGFDPRGVGASSIDGKDVAFQRRFDAFLAWIARGDGRYHLGATRAAVEASYRSIRAALAADPVDGRFGPDELDDTLHGDAYHNDGWADHAAALSAFHTRGDARPLLGEPRRGVHPEPRHLRESCRRRLPAPGYAATGRTGPRRAVRGATGPGSRGPRRRAQVT